MSPADDAAPYESERPIDMPSDGRPFGRVLLFGEERRVRVEDRLIPRSRKISGQRQQRPEDDVSVGILAAVVALAFEHAEPLRPIAVRLLLREGARQKIVQGLETTEGEEHFKGDLHDVARPPVAAGILFEPAWSEVMDERVVDEPGQDFTEPRGVTGHRTVGGRMNPQSQGHLPPISIGLCSRRFPRRD